MCRSHALIYEAGIPETDTIAVGLINVVDRWLSKNQGNEIVSGFTKAIQELLTPDRKAPQRPIPPPPSGPHRGHHASTPGPEAPPPGPAPEQPQQAREILGFPPDMKLTAQIIKQRQRDLADMFHPDKGGSLRAMQRVNDAAGVLLAKIR